MTSSESSRSEDYGKKTVFDTRGFPVSGEGDDDLLREVSRQGYLSRGTEVVDLFADGGQFDDQATMSQEPEEQT